MEPESVNELLNEILNDVEASIRKYKRTRIPPKIMRDLLKENERPKVRLFLASYPETPSRMLNLFAENEMSTMVAEAVAAHPRTPNTVLKDLALNAEECVRLQIAANKNLSPQVATVLSNDPSPMVRGTLAVNSLLPTRLHLPLAEDTIPFVRASLLKQKRLEQEALSTLANDDDFFVRAAVVIFANAEQHRLLEWADSDNELTQQMLLMRKNLSDEVIESLCFSTHTNIQLDAIPRRDITIEEMVGWLENGALPVRKLIAPKQGLPAVIQELVAKDSDMDVRAALALNPDLDEHIAAELFETGNTELSELLAQNPAIPAYVRSELCRSENPDILKLMIVRGDLSVDDLEELVSKADETILYHFAYKRRKLPSLPQQLADKLAQNTLPTLRILAAGAETLSDVSMSKLSIDKNETVRETLVGNRALPEKLLRFMLSDKLPEIAHRAAQRLKEREEQQRQTAIEKTEEEVPQEESSNFFKRIINKVIRND